jgi:hypothetical protein
MANTSAAELAAALTAILRYGNGSGSVNLYMAHGGSNWGFWAGMSAVLWSQAHLFLLFGVLWSLPHPFLLFASLWSLPHFFLLFAFLWSLPHLFQGCLPL